MPIEEYRIPLHARLVSPTGTKWRVIKKWSFPGNAVWFKIESEGGRIQNKMRFEFEGWTMDGKKL